MLKIIVRITGRDFAEEDAAQLWEDAYTILQQIDFMNTKTRPQACRDIYELNKTTFQAEVTESLDKFKTKGGIR